MVTLFPSSYKGEWSIYCPRSYFEWVTELRGCDHPWVLSCSAFLPFLLPSTPTLQSFASNPPAKPAGSPAPPLLPPQAPLHHALPHTGHWSNSYRVSLHPSARPQLFTLCLMTTVILSLDPIIASIAPRARSQVNSSPTRPFCPPHSLVPSCSLSVFRLSGLLSSPWTHQGYFCPVSLPSCCDPRSYMAVSHHLRFNLNVTPVEWPSLATQSTVTLPPPHTLTLIFLVRTL